MVADTKLYDLLGVSPSASDSEIKIAYKKLALRLHPDKNKGDEVAAEKFKEVSKAASVLTDQEKRRIYDSTGQDSDDHDGGGPDPSDIFSMLFGHSFRGGFGGRSKAPARTSNLERELPLTLEELYTGKTVKLAITRAVICSGCKGSGGLIGSTYSCRNCKGSGTCVVTQQIGPMIQQYETPCRQCNGTGGSVPDKDRCKSCMGKQTKEERKVLEVHVRRGMSEGQTLVFREEAAQEPGKTPGDIIFIVKEKPHAIYRREEEHLMAEVEIELVTALTGGDVPLKHLDGTTLMLRVNPGDVLIPGTTRKIPGRGFVVENQPAYGDLFIKIKVAFPTRAELSDERMSLLRAALPQTRVASKLSAMGAQLKDCEICYMQEVTERPRRSTGGRERGGEENGRHPQAMQCATQ